MKSIDDNLLEEQLDKVVFTGLVSKYTPKLRARLRGILKRSDLVDDAIQTTWMKAFRSRDTYNSNNGTIATWLTTIARNTAYDMLRSNGRYDANISYDVELEHLPNKTPNDSVDRRGILTKKAVNEAISQLPDSGRDIVRLHKIEGIPLTEIADCLDMNINTVRVRAHRSYKSLKPLLKKTMAEYGLV
jgi:RNA polymerase sigma-70 factor, ECF subfamily